MHSSQVQAVFQGLIQPLANAISALIMQPSIGERGAVGAGGWVDLET